MRLCIWILFVCVYQEEENSLSDAWSSFDPHGADNPIRSTAFRPMVASCKMSPGDVQWGQRRPGWFGVCFKVWIWNRYLTMPSYWLCKQGVVTNLWMFQSTYSTTGLRAPSVATLLRCNFLVPNRIISAIVWQREFSSEPIPAHRALSQQHEWRLWSRLHLLNKEKCQPSIKELGCLSFKRDSGRRKAPFV